MTRPRLNVLYLHSHDTGRYVQPYGHAVPTPAYQRLAEDGVLFRQNFAAAPTCSPSRAALLTGQYPHVCGMLGLVNRGFELEHPERHLAHFLRHAGYLTGLAGLQHVVRAPETTGYEWIRGGGGRAAVAAPAALQFLTEYASGNQERPFFLDVGFFETHRIFPKADPTQHASEDPRYCRPPAPLPDTPETRQDMADFKASARVLDAAAGQVLDALDQHGLADNTLVILTTDHGIAFPAMKCNLTDRGTGVLLIMRGPDGFSGGRVVDALVSHVDVFPTICDVAGLPPPQWLQGTSLAPLARGEVDSARDEVFAEVNYHCAYEPQRAVRTTRWKYVRRYDTYGKPMPSNCDEGHAKDVWLRHGWAGRTVDPEQLYDLVFDPLERHNLISDPRCSATVRELRDRLDRWMRETDDPLLRGPVPTPPTAIVNPPDEIPVGGLVGERMRREAAASQPAAAR